MIPELPFVTVIMPIRNEEKYIAGSLEAVLNQDYPAGRMEVLVADGMSTDRTREIVQRMAQGDPRVRLLDNPGRIVPTGLNLALRQARGEIMVRVDGHCIIAPDYVSHCVRLLQEGRADGVGGPMETVGEDPLSQTIALAMSSAFGVGGSAFRTVKDRELEVETVPFPAYRMETIRRIGLFDEEQVRNQDDEYNYRLLKHGGRILLSPAIRSRYYSRSSLKKLWRQYFQYGFWKVRVLQKHPRQLRLRQFVPPVFVAGLAGAAGPAGPRGAGAVRAGGRVVPAGQPGREPADRGALGLAAPAGAAAGFRHPAHWLRGRLPGGAGPVRRPLAAAFSRRAAGERGMIFTG
ncbi:MAG TPA: glycosyltransferase family 2 protein [Anaerolineaceae bacterium]|nr:glycosyltransferase family 2 protein [Anaerolineaceae bacterium]